MITSFSHIYYKVRDVDETIDFYTKNFGFRLLRKYEINGRPAAYLELGQVLLELSPAQPEEMPKPGERRIGLTAPDVDAVVEGLRKNGVEIVEDARPARTFLGRQAAIKDPNGHIITLREWQAPDGPGYEGWQPSHPEVVRKA